MGGDGGIERVIGAPMCRTIFSEQDFLGVGLSAFQRLKTRLRPPFSNLSSARRISGNDPLQNEKSKRFILGPGSARDRRSRVGTDFTSVLHSPVSTLSEVDVTIQCTLVTSQRRIGYQSEVGMNICYVSSVISEVEMHSRNPQGSCLCNVIAY